MQRLEDSTLAAAGCTSKGLDGSGPLTMGAGDGRRMDLYFTASPTNAAGGKGRHNIEGVFSSAMAKRAS